MPWTEIAEIGGTLRNRGKIGKWGDKSGQIGDKSQMDKSTNRGTTNRGTPRQIGGHHTYLLTKAFMFDVQIGGHHTYLLTKAFMFNRSFQEEFSEFKKAAYQYSKKFPALAPMLGKTSTDPDVERLFEGVAFLTTKLNEKLSDDFPEIIHELIRMIIPHYLKPLPAATIIKFNPLDSLSQKQIIPKGTYIDSEFVHDTIIDSSYFV